MSSKFLSFYISTKTHVRLLKTRQLVSQVSTNEFLMKKRHCTLFEMFFLNSWPIFTCQAKTEFYATKMTTVPSYLQCTKLLKVTAYVLHVICFNGKENYFLKKENGTFFSPSITLLNLFKFWASLSLICSLITCLSWETCKLYLYTNYYNSICIIQMSMYPIQNHVQIFM